MKFRLVSLLFVGLLLAVANVASAEIVVHVGLAYDTSYNADYSASSTLGNVVSSLGGGSLTTVTLPTATPYVNHMFNISMTVTGLAEGQDLVGFMMNKSVSGGASVAAGDYYVVNDVVDPPTMGPPNSNAPGAQEFNINEFNGTAWILDVRTGTGTGGMTGNTYGDYASFVHVGEGGAFVIGQQAIHDDNVAGGLSLLFKQSASTFAIISGNTNGAALDASAVSFVASANWTAIGDSAQFVVPEPGTLALLATGLVGLLAYAWRKRK
jgi:hypothetical protein